jgi:O-succinylbenzoic acid--CoA ligase
MEPWLQFQQKKFYLSDLTTAITQAQSDFEKASLDFISNWIKGKEVFTLNTSGSTGSPKIISVTRNQLKASAQLTITALRLHKNQTALICLDTRYIAGIMMIIRSLEAGMNMMLVEPCSNPLAQVDQDLAIDFTALVPLQVETILHSSYRKQFEKIKSILIGGAALNQRTINELKSLSCHCYATYGMTETLSHIALQKLNGSDAQDNFEALSGIALSKDERGCLVIHAPHLSNIPIVTNDLVEFVTPSAFRWLGRADNIINTGGVKVIPEKIEASIGLILDNFNISTRFFIAGLPDPLLGQSVTLIMEGDVLPVHLEELLQKKIMELPDRFERPKSIHYVSEFINTDTGKINKLKTITLLQV